MKTIVRKSSVFAIALLIANLFFVSVALGQTTRTWVPTAGGAWTTAGNWSPGAVPATGDNVIINTDQSAAITAVPTISLNSLTINGNCSFNAATAGNTITITGASFIVASGKTLTLGTSNTFNFTVSSTGSGTISGTVNLVSGGTVRTFTNSGDLTITGTGLIDDVGATGSNSYFTLSSGATLRIGSTAGITATGGATGNIQVAGTRNYNGAANYIYNGSADQVTGNGLVTANNLTINTGSSSTTVTSATPFTATNLTVSQGNLILQGTSANYAVTNDLTIATNGTLTHSVNWDVSGKLLSVGGNIIIDGIFGYTVRSHVQMTGSGTKTVRTGANAASAFSILTLQNGTFNANGTLKVNDNFWAMFGTAGSFHTSGQTVTASAGVLINGGTVYIDGGTLNVNAGITVGAGTNGAVVFSSGILNTDGITIGNGTQTGTFAQSGGTTNLSGSLLIYPSCSFTCTNSPIINIGGDWTKNGTYTKATETVTFNRIGDQTIGGTTATSFYNLVFSGSGAKTVPNGTSVAGNLNISGAKANLIAGINVPVNSLSLSGANQPAGTWGSTSSGATYKNNTYFTATTGILTVATGAALPTPTFTGLTASHGICPGTTTMALSGTVSAAGPVYPANGETVGVKINGITQNAIIAGGAGGFSINFNTSALPASGTPYTITYSYAGGIHLSAALDNASTTVIVNNPTAAVTSQTNITCFNANDGTITILANGGTSPYSYSVNNGTTWISSANNPYLYGGLAANTPYRIKVKDMNGCISK